MTSAAKEARRKADEETKRRIREWREKQEAEKAAADKVNCDLIYCGFVCSHVSILFTMPDPYTNARCAYGGRHDGSDGFICPNVFFEDVLLEKQF